MITVLINDGSHYKFKSPKEAGNWIHKHADLYNYDTNNLIVVSDRKLDVPTIEVLKKTIIIDCKECKSQLRMETEHETDFAVECPACGVRNLVKM